MKYTIEFSNEGLKRQFGKVPSPIEMCEIISKALASYVFERQFLALGTKDRGGHRTTTRKPSPKRTVVARNLRNLLESKVLL